MIKYLTYQSIKELNFLNKMQQFADELFESVTILWGWCLKG